MKKNIGFLVIMVLAIALSACGKKAEPAPAQGSTAAPVAEAPKAEAPVEEDKGVFASIKDAVSKSIPIKCNYTDPDGTKAVAYFKGKVVRIEAQANGDAPASHGIIRDNKMYVWADQSPSGLLLDFAKMGSGESAWKVGEAPINSSDEFIAEIDKMKEGCTREVVSDSMFDLPANIEFVGF